MNVLYGMPSDIESWMKLVNQVRWNFPGLETKAGLDEHKNTVLRFMQEKRALCVKQKDNVIGVLLFSKKHNMICCLAVSPQHRKNGIAAIMLARAIELLDDSRGIIVSTFREDDEKGTAPRALYKKFGFAEGELIEEFGYPHQKFILYPRDPIY